MVGKFGPTLKQTATMIGTIVIIMKSDFQNKFPADGRLISEIYNDEIGFQLCVLSVAQDQLDQRCDNSFELARRRS